jgi:hypothetical protein
MATKAEKVLTKASQYISWRASLKGKGGHVPQSWATAQEVLQELAAEAAHNDIEVPDDTQD